METLSEWIPPEALVLFAILSILAIGYVLESIFRELKEIRNLLESLKQRDKMDLT